MSNGARILSEICVPKVVESVGELGVEMGDAYRSPAVVFYSVVPAFVLLWVVALVELDVHDVLLLLLLKLHVVAWRERTDVAQRPVRKYFIINQRGKFLSVSGVITVYLSTQSEPNVALRCCVY